MKDVLTVKVFISYNALHCIVCIQCIVTDEDLRGQNTFISICIELHCIVCIQCIVTDEDLCGQNIFHFNLFLLLRDCSRIAQTYSAVY